VTLRLGRRDYTILVCLMGSQVTAREMCVRSGGGGGVRECSVVAVVQLLSSGERWRLDGGSAWFGVLLATIFSTFKCRVIVKSSVNFESLRLKLPHVRAPRVALHSAARADATRLNSRCYPSGHQVTLFSYHTKFTLPSITQHHGPLSHGSRPHGPRHARHGPRTSV
jgi:hypothetical protein